MYKADEGFILMEGVNPPTPGKSEDEFKSIPDGGGMQIHSNLRNVTSILIGLPWYR